MSVTEITLDKDECAYVMKAHIGSAFDVPLEEQQVFD